MEMCPSCLGGGKQWVEVPDSADLQATDCWQCEGSGEIRAKRTSHTWELWNWKGFLAILTIFEILTQSPLFILYLFHGGGPVTHLTIWHYISAVGAMTLIPILLVAIPAIALIEES